MEEAQNFGDTTHLTRSSTPPVRNRSVSAACNDLAPKSIAEATGCNGATGRFD